MSKILLVDDDEISLTIYSEIIRKAGYTIDIFQLPADALHAFKEEKDYDLIITDYHMPGINGIEFKNEIRKISKTIPVILLTGRQDVISSLTNNNKEYKVIEEEKIFYIETFKFDDYVNKFWPSNHEEILKSIKNLL